MQQAKMIINGTPKTSDNVVDVINPATEKVFAQCHFSTKSDVDDAVAVARSAFSKWSALSDEQRKQKLFEVADLLEANMPKLMELVTLESGKPVNGLNGVGSGMEIGGSIAWTRATASLDLPIEVIQDDDEARIEVHRKPLGVVASITPWNWPLMIAIWHVIPALRAGNTVIIKPSPYTPVATSKFVQLANSVLPEGVLNIVHGDTEIGTAISTHKGINKIIFTGSTPTGKKIMELSAATLKRLTLELGGNDAGIVLPGADIESMADKLFGVAFHNNGQTCAALKRLYVHQSQYDDVCKALVQRAKSAKVGDGLKPDTELGPLQNARQLHIIKSIMGNVQESGGNILSGGHELDGEGYFYAPTIVADQTDGDRIVDEEQFGPILPVIKYSDLDEVISRVNRNEAGLGGSVWSSDLKVAKAVATRLECGTVWINDHGSVQPNAPFGGIKQSGLGVEFGVQGLKECTSIQTVKVTEL